MASLKSNTNWRERISLSAYLTSLVIFVIIFISGILSYYVFSVLKENKYRDITSIMFLELEKQTHHIKQKLDAFENEILVQTNYMKNPDSADNIYKFTDEQNLVLVKGGVIPKNIKLIDFGVEKQDAIQQMTLLQISGLSFFAKIIEVDSTQSKYLCLWQIDLGELAGLGNRISNESEVYVLSREFKLMFRNSIEIREEGLVERRLIQHFIETSVRKGQFKFRKKDRNYYGFYAEIPSTNIVLFSETSESVITDRIFALLKNFALGVLVMLVLSIILVQLILPSITRPLYELVQIAKMISLGRFRFATQTQGFGEINALIQAFGRMGSDLETRDREITTLLEDKEERARLDQELLIAKKIQENFLPQSMESQKKGVFIGSFYQPAEEVAGDWYQHFYDEKTGEFIAIIADVSGHGAGSSMFTAVIAAQFEEFKIARSEQHDIYTFINNLNTIFRQLGKGEWHATLLICIVSADRKKLTFINCGHPFPLVLQKTGGKNKVSTMKMPSTPIGLEAIIKTATKSLEIADHTSVLFFTDGIIEAENPEHKPFGRKRLALIFEEITDTSPTQVIKTIFGMWKRYIKTEKPKDDICLYSLEIEH